MKIFLVLSAFVGSVFWLGHANAACGNGILESGEDCEWIPLQGLVFRHSSCQAFDSKYKSGTLNCSQTLIGPRACNYDTSKCSEESGPLCDYSIGGSGYSCGDHCGFYTPVCGNGCTEGTEECDEGVLNSDFRPNACRSDCELPHCGDSVIDAGEQCDDGPRNSNFVPDACRTNCVLPRCGDGIIDVGRGEQCDLGAANSDAIGSLCSTTCIIPFCGNGVLETGETCDDGNFSSMDLCTQSCRPNVCGDGFVLNVLEICDGGNCDYACFRDPTLCGNGILEVSEECDEGNSNAEVPNAPCRTDCMLPRCGDGVVDAGEQCDRTPGCLSDCTLLP